MRKALLLTTVSACVVWTGSAHAQTVGADAAGASGGEIIVTARKRAESIVDVPVAVTALSAQDLDAARIQNLSDLQQFTPGFQLAESSSGGATRGFQTFTARGIYPGTDHPDRQVVSIFIDGVPVGGGGAIPSLSNVASVEVVNGPQSAYFGRSTFAGAVNLITKAPAFELGGHVEAAAWNDDSYELRGQLEGPLIGDVLAGRIALRSWQQGAPYKSFGYNNDLGKRTSRSAELSLAFRPTSTLRFDLFGAAWVDQDGPPAQGLLIAEDYNCDAGAGGGSFNYICGKIDGYPDIRMAQPPLSDENLAILNSNDEVLGGNFNKQQGFRREAHFVNLRMEYDIADNMVLGASGGISQNHWANIIDLANRFNPGRYSTFLVSWDIESKSAEVRLGSSGDTRLTYLIGANYFEQDVFNKANAVRDGAVIAGNAPTNSRINTTGIFGSLGYELFDGLTASVEGRYQWDKISSASTAPGATRSGGTSKAFTPRVILSYAFNPDVNVYASYSEGTRPAQYNANLYALPQEVIDEVLAQADVPLQVPDERLKMGEVGFKGNLFDRKLTVLLAAYYGNWGNRQVATQISYTDPVDGGSRVVPVVLASGEVDLWGLEAQLRARPMTGLTLGATLGYSETDIKSTNCSDCTAVTGNSNPVGNRLGRYPAHTGSAFAEYEAPAFRDFDGYIRSDYTYTGRIYATEANVTYLAPAHRVNLRAGVRNDVISIEAFGTNIFGSDVPLSIARGNDTYTRANTISLAAPPPTTYGLRVGFDF